MGMNLRNSLNNGLNTGLRQSISGGFGLAYVTQGLEVYLDAGNTNSYGGTGTTWSDLSGNGNDATLFNAPTFDSADGGSFDFDGTDDHAQVSGSTTVSAATFIAWCKISRADVNSFAGIVFSRGTNTSGLNFRGSGGRIGYHWNDHSSTYNWSAGPMIADNEWCMVALTVTSTEATAYVYTSSGTTSSTNTVSHASSTIDDINIAQDEGQATRRYDGKISIAMFYDRALSSTELTKNFNAFKSRYGY